MNSAYRLYSSRLKREIIVYLSRDLLTSSSLALIYYLVNIFTFLSISRSIYIKLRYFNIIRYFFRSSNIYFLLYIAYLFKRRRFTLSLKSIIRSS